MSALYDPFPPEGDDGCEIDMVHVPPPGHGLVEVSFPSTIENEGRVGTVADPRGAPDVAEIACTTESLTAGVDADEVDEDVAEVVAALLGEVGEAPQPAPASAIATARPASRSHMVMVSLGED